MTDALDSSCNGTIMGRPNIGQPYQMHSDACLAADHRWVTDFEMEGSSTDDDDLNQDCEGGGCSPILVDVAWDGFHLTGAEQPVAFDMDGDGEKESLSWTSLGSDDAFLALDRNRNGLIDDGRELFGNFTPQPRGTVRNGFRALAIFDQPSLGGDGDGSITHRDAVYDFLLLWSDRNRDGISQTNELRRLEQEDIREIDLDFVEARRRDRHGNLFRWASRIVTSRQQGLKAIDVIFVDE